MTRGKKIAAIVAGSIAGLILLIVIAAIVTVQTSWFRNFVREKIVAAVEESTGGKVDVGSFSFDWTHLRATVRDFVIHGLEPQGAAPLLRAKLIQVDLKLLSPLKGFVDIAYLLVDTPQANVMVFPDGHTNIPAPKIQHPSNKSGLETVVDLAIGHFDLRNGTAVFADQASHFNASGDNLRAQLGYNAANPSYTGEIDVSPLHARLAENAPVDVNVKLPLHLEKDKITLTTGELSTPESHIVISAEADHLAAMHATAHVNAKVALDEVSRVAGLQSTLDTRRGPRVVDADITASMDPNYVRIQSARVSVGSSNIEASGTLKDPQGKGAAQFRATLAVAELGRLLRVSAQPEGTVQAGGNVSLVGSDYRVTANVVGRGLGMREGTTRLSGIELASSVSADPHRIALAGLRIQALGGTFGGSAEIQDMQRYRVEGRLNDFQIGTISRTFLHKPVGYTGALSGEVAANGNLKKSTDLAARANLAITPGAPAAGAIPVAGRLNLDYRAASDLVTLDRSYVALPHTRVDVSGSLNRQIQVRLVSNDLADDLRPVANVPVTFNRGGSATVNATVAGNLSTPRIDGQIAVTNFTVEERTFSGLTANVAASPSNVTLTNATLTGVGANGGAGLQAQFSAAVGLHNWSPEPYDPLRVDATVRRADVQDLVALAGQSNVPMTGALTADVHVAGTVGSPQGNADVTVANGSIEQERFDQLLVRVAMDERTINVPTLQLTAGAARIDGNATFQHPVNDMKRGSITARVNSTDIHLAQLRTVNGAPQNLDGVVSLNANAAATLAPGANGTEFQIGSLNANLNARQLRMNGQNLGNLTATANSSGSAIHYNVDSNFAGSTIRVNGQTLMAGDHRTTASAQISNLAINRALAVAGRSDMPINGTVALNAQFAGALQNSKPLIQTLDGNLSVRGLTANGKKLGELTATAATSGNAVNFNLTSDVAQSDIRGNGRLQLTSDYPINAQVSFSKVTYAGLQPLLGGEPEPFDAEVDGQATVAGPVTQTDALRGSLVLTKVQARAVPTPGLKQPRIAFEVHNAGNVDIALDRGIVNIRNFKLAGQYTNLSVTGTVPITGTAAMNVRANGDVQLGALEAFNRDIFASGSVTLDAAVTGTMSKPDVRGRLQLNKASFNMMSAPNGISNANGTVAFSGTQAILQNVTGETGGGKVTLAGLVDYGGDEMALRLQATADRVHVDYPQTVTTEFNARITIAGTTSNNLVSGTVTITDVGMHSHTDIGSVLTSAATPPSANSPSTGVLGGMRFDVRIETAPGTQFRTSLTQNLQADVNLTLRGTPDRPGMLGRVVVTEGEIVFFGAKYDIDQGTITFTDPHKINPLLNVNLTTTVQGINVSLSVSGPMDKMKLSYSSDPPLQFQDIVSLLASGKVPTSDPVLAARQPVAPQQSFEQAGASAVLGQAIANPIAGRLQRLFGVTKLSINPQIVGQTSTTAQATLTLQQQINRDLTFTYIQDVAAANQMLIRVEWAISPTWSAIAQRDQYGLFDVDFYYKKRFH